jgi:hypothetical protein
MIALPRTEWDEGVGGGEGLKSLHFFGGDENIPQMIVLVNTQL